jgi:diguanylate cyclase (GGDEF)-like protein
MTPRSLGNFIPVELTAGRRPRLLIIDDQPLMVQALYQVFERDCQVFMGTRGEQALSLCRTHRPDLVLMDVVMPGMDGFEACRNLKADLDTRDIPIIFVTAKDDEAAEAKGLDAGAVDFLTKPVNPRIVRARVRTHLMLKLQSDLLRRMVFVDGLTGVFNRRHFDERLEAEWGRALRNHTELSLLMIDVDHFKAYNDRHGHQAGDACLREIAKVLRRCIKRSGDIIARFGGEEFACILPETETETVMSLACMIEQRIREDVGASASLPDLGSPVTVSIGVATKPAAIDANRFGVSDLLALADQQLYAAKATGRARVLGRALGSDVPLLMVPLTPFASPDADSDTVADPTL